MWWCLVPGPRVHNYMACNDAGVRPRSHDRARHRCQSLVVHTYDVYVTTSNDNTCCCCAAVLIIIHYNVCSARSDVYRITAAYHAAVRETTFIISKRRRLRVVNFGLIIPWIRRRCRFDPLASNTVTKSRPFPFFFFSLLKFIIEINDCRPPSATGTPCRVNVVFYT